MSSPSSSDSIKAPWSSKSLVGHCPGDEESTLANWRMHPIAQASSAMAPDICIEMWARMVASSIGGGGGSGGAGECGMGGFPGGNGLGAGLNGWGGEGGRGG